MSERPKEVIQKAAQKVTQSGQHSAVQQFRKKLDSVTDSTLPLAKQLNERIDKARRRRTDPRVEPPEEETEDSNKTSAAPLKPR